MAQRPRDRKQKIAARVKGVGDLSIREYRSSVAKLKNAGLISHNIDARSHKPTRYMREQISKYKGILKGTEKAVKVGRSNARDFSGSHKTKFDRVVVEATRDDKVRYNRKLDEIIIKAAPTVRAQRERTVVIVPRLATEIPPLKPGHIYGVAMKRGTRIDYIELGDGNDLRFFLNEYSKKGKDLSAYIVMLDDSSNDDSEEADDDE